MEEYNGLHFHIEHGLQVVLPFCDVVLGREKSKGRWLDKRVNV